MLGNALKCKLQFRVYELCTSSSWFLYTETMEENTIIDINY